MTDENLPAGITRRLFEFGSDEEKFLEVLNAAFERWPVAEIDVPQLDHLRWKVRSHPDVEIRMGVGEVDGRVVVSSVNIRQEVKVGDRIAVAYQTTDAAILPEFQNIGFSKAARDVPMPEQDRALEGVDLGFSVGRAHPAFERLRASDPDPRPRVTRHLEALLRQPGGMPAPAPRGPWQIAPVSNVDERIDVFWEDASRPFAFMLVKKSEYVNWRYCDRRAGPFVIKTAQENGRILGFVVYRVSYGRGFVADLLALPGRLDVAEALLAGALRDLESRNVDAVECWSYARHPYWPLLQRYGFINKRRTMMASLTLAEKSSLTPADLRMVRDPDAVVHVMSGDTDLV